MKLKESVEIWLRTSLGDPIAKTLAENSQLSPVQLETLLIDLLAENLAGKALTYDEKARLRLLKAKVSRGAFNRTLKQAKENAIKSIYTVILLGYLGVFESTTLDPYVEIANKLQNYLDSYKDTPDRSTGLDNHLRAMEIIRQELETSLKSLSNPSEGML